MKHLYLLLVFAGTTVTSFAQENRLTRPPVSSATIYHNIEKLGFLGSALFVAAHPDDENTRLISWLANDRHARTAYLSLTRGDGGQNLIGQQLREQLGLIRTQELLEARNIDNGLQFFTRANDFGYSKHPDETLEIWNKQQVVEDMVRIIRTFKPDVIINRFDHRSPGTTHGHHTSSAMLSMLAFKSAGLKSSYGNQLNTLAPWQPDRIFFNTSWWFYGSEEAFEKANKKNLLLINAGTYYPWNGYSNGEIAALSRSKHKSQGFGSSGSRGSQTEYLEFLDGSFPENKEDLFSGINTSWTRVKGGEQIQTLWKKIRDNYNFKNPEASLNDLLEMRNLILNLKDAHWQNIKLEEINNIILDIAGIYIELTAKTSQATPGQTYNLNLELTNRSSSEVTFEIASNNLLEAATTQHRVRSNNVVMTKMQLHIPQGYETSTPYWLKKPGTTGMYTVDNSLDITKPESDPAFKTFVTVKIGAANISQAIPVIYKSTDPVRGEVREPLNVVPAVSLAIANPVYVFNDTPQNIAVNLTAFKDLKNVIVQLNHPESWEVTPASQTIENLKKGNTQQVVFTVKAPAITTSGIIQASAQVDDAVYLENVITLDFNHIPNQQYVIPATATVINPAIINQAKRVAYITGAGDDVPAALEAMGIKVDLFIPATLPDALTSYDAIVVGIRAANVHPDLPLLKNRIANYVENGGTFIMQYNTSGGFDANALGPLKISLSRKRVTDENAAVTFLNPDHKILHTPNKLSTADFDNWVQERGLYFPDSWDATFTPILGMNDAGEPMNKGSLLVAPYGKGHIIYTGLSLFRELPAGVIGAYRLMANMLNISK